MTATRAVGAGVRASSCRVGVDGGGTRSRALVGDGVGRELGAADGGPGLIDLRDPERAVPAVGEVVLCWGEHLDGRLGVPGLTAPVGDDAEDPGTVSVSVF